MSINIIILLCWSIWSVWNKFIFNGEAISKNRYKFLFEELVAMVYPLCKDILPLDQGIARELCLILFIFFVSFFLFLDHFISKNTMEMMLLSKDYAT